jgi:hypothetical protein
MQVVSLKVSQVLGARIFHAHGSTKIGWPGIDGTDYVPTDGRSADHMLYIPNTVDQLHATVSVGCEYHAVQSIRRNLLVYHAMQFCLLCHVSRMDSCYLYSMLPPSQESAMESKAFQWPVKGLFRQDPMSEAGKQAMDNDRCATSAACIPMSTFTEF